MDFENIQLSFSDIPSTKNIALKPVESKYKKVIIYSWSIAYAMLSASLLVSYFLIDKLNQNTKVLYIGISIYLLLIIITFLWIHIEFKYRSFAIRQKDILYKSGWLFQKTTAVPYNKIQHCSVTQGVLSRMFSLANLQIFTAASNNFDVTIKGLKLSEAEHLKDWLMEQNKQ